MIINPDRIKTALAGEDFQLAYFCEATWDIVYYRKRSPSLFERIAIHQGWRRGQQMGQVVSASVECSIVPGRTALKGMAEVSCITEIASDAGRGSTVLESSTDARTWEDALIAVGPARASSFAGEVGAALLEETKDDRCAVQRYEQIITIDRDLNELRQTLRSRASPEQQSVVDQILKCRIRWIPEGRIYYELAALTVVLCAADVGPTVRWYVGLDPEDGRNALGRQLQILASRFANEPGWD